MVWIPEKISPKKKGFAEGILTPFETKIMQNWELWTRISMASTHPCLFIHNSPLYIIYPHWYILCAHRSNICARKASSLGRRKKWFCFSFTGKSYILDTIFNALPDELQYFKSSNFIQDLRANTCKSVCLHWAKMTLSSKATYCFACVVFIFTQYTSLATPSDTKQPEQLL